MPSWDPGQYLRFGDERARPFAELVARIPLDSARRVVDLGCGPGTETARLRDRWPDAAVAGIDNSEAMIGQARALEGPGLTFELADLRDFEPADLPVDVVVCNATLHWVPGHLDLLGRWLGWLRPGGALAVGVPGNFAAPSHTLLRDLAADVRWREALRGVASLLDPHEPVEYLRRLVELGTHADVWETTYYHLLDGPDPVLEWVRGSALRPYLDALDHDAAEAFSAQYAAALRRAYPPGPDARTTFPFRRIFALALRPG